MHKDVSVITGGSGGMGKAIARELGCNSKLVLAARNEERLHTTQKELESLGYDAVVFPVDVSSTERVKALAEYASHLGDVTNVIHTAGVSPTDSSVDKILSVNAMGTIHVTEAFHPILAQGGVMINFASLAAYTMEAPDEWYEVFDNCSDSAFYDKMQELINPFQGDDFVCAGVAYCISKRFVIFYSQKNTVRFANKGCRILSISPGSYMTPMHQKLIDNQPDTAEAQKESIPFMRWGHPYEVASLTGFLCSPGAGFMSGIDVLTDGGQIANTFVSQIE
ncbi:SDR family oxidoreductase [Clostridia bacterium OttesenSCG-928-O13]|nr:SDR family oxidoreductase [Clostridia bacterium OttesenSCG-928-O13]